jgi:hypothetical protein
MENKKMMFLGVIAFMLVICVNGVQAVPVIEDVTITPETVWKGDDVIINLRCFDNEGYSITQVYALVTGPGVFLPPLDFSPLGGDVYSLQISSSYLTKTGSYTADIVCLNDQGSNSSSSNPFDVSVLTGNIAYVEPDPVYVGGAVDIGFSVEKDGISISPFSTVSFQVLLNGDEYTIKNLPFVVEDAWKLTIDSPGISGLYDVSVTAAYDGSSATNSSSIEVKNLVNFDVVSVDNSLVAPEENITLSVRADEKGVPIALDSGMLSVEINSEPATILDVLENGDLYNVKVSPPSLVPGNYSLVVGFVYENYSFSRTEGVVYAVPVSGEILNNDEKGVKLEIKFTSKDTGKITSISTDSEGMYSGKLAPGDYDIKVIHKQAEMQLFDSSLNEEYGSIRLTPLNGVNILGMVIAGIYAAESSVSYSDVELKLGYSDGVIKNEDDLKLFKCSNWNSGKRDCNSEWTVVPIEKRDIVGNVIEASPDSLSVFAIGAVNSLKIEASLSKDVYNLDDTVKITGFVRDEFNTPVPDVQVDILGSGIVHTTTSDAGGIFSFEFPAQGDEGVRTFTLTATRSPYIIATLAKEFTLEKSREIFINFPDVKVEQGDNTTFIMSVRNMGQADEKGLQITISGIPEEFYEIMTTSLDIPPKEERDVEVFFNVLPGTKPTVYSGKVIINGSGVNVEKRFAFTIVEMFEEVEETAPAFDLWPKFDLPTGDIILNDINSNMSYIIVLLVVVVVLVYFIKRRKHRDFERLEVTSVLSDIKREIRRDGDHQAHARYDRRERKW